jgi:hypothetical protein
MNRSLVISCILVGCVLFSVLGNNTETDAKVDAQAWSAITNKFYSDARGYLLYRMKDMLADAPITTNLVLNGYLSAIIPKVRIYQVGIINVRNNLKRDKASLVVDGDRFTFIETDEEAVNFLNTNRCQNTYSTVLAVQDVLAFGELRGYKMLTKETLEILMRSSSAKLDVSSWSFRILEGENENTIEGTFLTYYKLEFPNVIFSQRFYFKFNKYGKMIFVKAEDSGSVGGFK